MKHLLLTGLLALLPLLAACEQAANDKSGPIDGVALTRHVGFLAADELGGRAPGSPGEDKTVEYLAQQFAALGLAPGNGEEWFQEVPMVKITVDPTATMEIAGGEDPLEFAYGEEMIAFTRSTETLIELTDSELVFAGYGIVASEYDWNDYEGLDVAGKTVVVLVNDPGFATQDPELFTGNAMTYYGRWTYKYEEAARQGAAGCIIVHETAAAGYPWEVVTGSWSGPQFDLAADGSDEYRLPLQAWITRDAAERLFAAAGRNYADEKQRALTEDFQATSLGQSLNIAFASEIETLQSRNVLAALPGDTRPEETIIYTAHWDHLGTDPALTDDPIYNGAVDNATGVAGLLALAQAFAELEKPLERTVLFLAVTGEESGLLGSRWYAENPVYPLAETVAVINMDSMNVYGLTRDVTVIGAGSSELEEYLARAAEAQGRVTEPEEHPERGYYFRSDHFNFAKQGVPALYAESGSEYIGEDAAAAGKRAEAYTANHYHKPSDEYAEWWNLTGAVQDLELYFAIGKELANATDFPRWYEGHAFRAIRQESAELRQDNP